MQLTAIEQFALERLAKGHSLNKTCRNFKIHRTQLYRNFRRSVKVNGLSSVKDLVNQYREAAC